MLPEVIVCLVMDMLVIIIVTVTPFTLRGEVSTPHNFLSYTSFLTCY